MACKEWNGVPPADRNGRGFDFLGQSYDNTGELGADTWRHVAFIEQKRPAERGREPERRLPLADELRRVQALHVGRLPRGVPHRARCAHRVRHRRGAGGRLQRVRVLRSGVPVRGDRPAAGRRSGVEVHHVLRPAAGRTRAGVRHRLPHQVDPVRARWTSCGTGPRPGSTPCMRPGWPRPACTARTRTTVSTAWAPSSSSSTIPRSTACPPTPSSPPATSPRCGARPPPPPQPWPSAWSPPSPAAAAAAATMTRVAGRACRDVGSRHSSARSIRAHVAR